MTHAIVLIEADRQAIKTLGSELADVVTGQFAALQGIKRTHTLVAFEVFSQHDLEALFSIGT